MHRDTQIGLVMAIVLIGFAAALCTPRESREESSALALPNAVELDARIARSQVRVYTDAVHPDEKSSPHAAVTPAASPETATITPNASSPAEELPRTADAAPVVDSLAVAFPQAVAPPANPMSETEAGVTAQLSGGIVRVEDGPGLTPSPSFSAAEPPEQIANTRPSTHVVAPGDTLSGLALRYLGSVARFPEIYEANRDVLRSPDDLKLGMVLRIPSEVAAPTEPAIDPWLPVFDDATSEATLANQPADGTR
jgi:nucleoid-associated protein YgaU